MEEFDPMVMAIDGVKFILIALDKIKLLLIAVDEVDLIVWAMGKCNLVLRLCVRLTSSSDWWNR